MRPPIRSRASTTSAETCARASSAAAVSPAAPAPMMRTSYGIIRPRSLHDACAHGLPEAEHGRPRRCAADVHTQGEKEHPGSEEQSLPAEYRVFPRKERRREEHERGSPMRPSLAQKKCFVTADVCYAPPWRGNACVCHWAGALCVTDV